MTSQPDSDTATSWEENVAALGADFLLPFDAAALPFLPLLEAAPVAFAFPLWLQPDDVDGTAFEPLPFTGNGRISNLLPFSADADEQGLEFSEDVDATAFDSLLFSEEQAAFNFDLLLFSEVAVFKPLPFAEFLIEALDFLPLVDEEVDGHGSNVGSLSDFLGLDFFLLDDGSDTSGSNLSTDTTHWDSGSLLDERNDFDLDLLLFFEATIPAS
jgi:hypothetical protein